MKRKAGSHTKPYKAQRGKLNREGWDGWLKDVGEMAITAGLFAPLAQWI